MHKILYVLVLSALLCGAACSEKTIEPMAKKGTMPPFGKMHGDDGANSTNIDKFSEIVRKKSLPDYPAMSIGKAFDSYAFMTKKKWTETRVANGTIYVDFSGWFANKSIDVDSIRKGVAAQGLGIKFVIAPQGQFFVAMVSKLEAMTNGTVVSYPVPESGFKTIFDCIYSDKELAF